MILLHLLREQLEQVFIVNNRYKILCLQAARGNKHCLITQTKRIRAMKKLPAIKGLKYASLLEDLAKIKNEIEQSTIQKINAIVLQGYWKMGQRFYKEKIFKDEISNQTGPVLHHLAEGLGMEYTLLTRIIKFYKMWPRQCPVAKNPNLGWSHYKSLMVIPDKKRRDFYQKQASKNRWNKIQLASRVKNEYFESLTTQKESNNQLSKIKQSLYYYSGTVQKVVDGDTLVIDVDLGFYVHIEVRVRLRGINAQELSAEDPKTLKMAEKAKEFVENALKSVNLIVFQSFRVDLYGRYVVDLYYLPGVKDREEIFKDGRFLNQELVDAGLALIC